MCFALILIRKKLRYVRFPPNLAYRKLIDLANYVPSSSPHRVLSFEKLESMGIWSSDTSLIFGGFCEERKLVSTNFNQIQVKQIILKDSGG